MPQLQEAHVTPQPSAQADGKTKMSTIGWWRTVVRFPKASYEKDRAS